MKSIVDIIKELEQRQAVGKDADLMVSYRKDVVPLIQEIHRLQASLELYDKAMAEAEVHAQRFVFTFRTVSKMRGTGDE